MNVARNLTFLALLVMALSGAVTTTAAAQALGPAFAGDYTLSLLPPVPGVTGAQGGLAFRPGNPNKLLVVGQSALPSAAIYEVDVTRDATGHITGFAGPATFAASAPNADGGLQFGPGAVLFFTTRPTNLLGQIEPGSVAPDRHIHLTLLGVAPSTGGVAFPPVGFPGAGRVMLTSYDASEWYSAVYNHDGMGTYSLNNLVLGASASAGTGLQGIAHVDAHYPGFSTYSALVCEWDGSSVGAYELDGSGHIEPALRHTFLTGYSCTGVTVDPGTGALLFAAHDGSSMLLVEPSTRVFLGTSYCAPAAPNSLGHSGALSAIGSQSVAANDVTLHASNLTVNSFGFFLTSRTQGMVNQPGGTPGVLCLGGSIGRYIGPFQPQNTGMSRSFSLALDLAATPTPMGFVQVVAGETWHFQAWHRDGGYSVPSSNFTHALSIPFH